MFLGDSSMTDAEICYLPLLSIWKKKAALGDQEAASKVKLTESLPKIQLLNSQESYGLPKEAEAMFSHGGYKVIFTVTTSGESIFAIRDINGSSKDEAGRAIPFLMVIVGTTADDAKILEKVAVFACSHLDTVSHDLAEFFYYDPTKNGVIFKLSAMNAMVAKIAAEGSNSLLTLDGSKTIQAKRGTVSLLVLPEGITKELAVAEQGLAGMPVVTVPIARILPLDNQKKLASVLNNVKDVKSSVFTDKRVQYIIGGAIILGFIAGYFVGRS